MVVPLVQLLTLSALANCVEQYPARPLPPQPAPRSWRTRVGRCRPKHNDTFLDSFPAGAALAMRVGRLILLPSGSPLRFASFRRPCSRAAPDCRGVCTHSDTAP